MTEKEKRPVRIDVSLGGGNSKRKLSRFRAWLASILGLSEDEAGREAAAAYVSSAYGAGLEKLREIAIRNEQMEAQIRKALAETRLHDAQAAKTKAETRAIDVRLRLEALQGLKSLGIDIVPLLDDGEVKGLFVFKPKDRR